MSVFSACMFYFQRCLNVHFTVFTVFQICHASHCLCTCCSSVGLDICYSLFLSLAVLRIEPKALNMVAILNYNPSLVLLLLNLFCLFVLFWDPRTCCEVHRGLELLDLAGLNLMAILLSQSPKYWDYRLEPLLPIALLLLTGLFHSVFKTVYELVFSLKFS